MTNVASASSPPLAESTLDVEWVWTPDLEARAVRLFLAEGLSATEVAIVLGGVSRSAVTAKIRRLGFRKRGRAAGVGRTSYRQAADGASVVILHQPRVERRLPPQRPPVPLPPLREVCATGAPVTLAGLADNACRWPIDDPGPGCMHQTLFCAGPTEGAVYCLAHRALASSRLAP